MNHNFKISIKASDGEVMATVDATVTADNTSGAFGALNQIIAGEIESFSECSNVSIIINRVEDSKSFSEIVQKYETPPVESETDNKPSKGWAKYADEKYTDESAACDPLSHNADVINSGKCSTCSQVNIL